MNLQTRWGLPWIAVLAGAHTLVDTNLVGDGTSASSEGSADERSFTSAGEAPDDCATGGLAADDLGAGVVAVVVAALGGYGAAVLVVALGYAG